jgi:hypothetical protein
MEDYYEILGCSHTASTEEIAQAYRRSALKFHPDKISHDTTCKNSADSLKHATERFILLTDAYETLRDPDRRHAYNLRKKMYGSSEYAEEEAKEMKKNEVPWTLDTLYQYLIGSPMWKWGWLWLRNFDPVLSDVTQRWVDEITQHYMMENNVLTKSECVQWCANIVKNYLERKFSIPEYHNIYKLQLTTYLIEQSHINIECSLDFIRKYSAVDIWHESKHQYALARFDLRNDICCLRYIDRKITFEFMDKFPENTFRFGLYDIQMKISLSPAMITKKIRLTHEYEKDNPLVTNIHIDGKTHIYRLKGKGIYDATYRKWGDCYLCISLEEVDTSGCRDKNIYRYDILSDEPDVGTTDVYSSITLEEMQEIFSV